MRDDVLGPAPVRAGSNEALSIDLDSGICLLGAISTDSNLSVDKHVVPRRQGMVGLLPGGLARTDCNVQASQQ